MFVIVISEAMEKNKVRKNPVDFIELISPELPWDEIAVALGEKPDQLVTDNDTSLPAEQLTATVSSAVCVKEDAAIGTDVAQGIETDFCEDEFSYLDEISVSSPLGGITAPSVTDGAVTSLLAAVDVLLFREFASSLPEADLSEDDDCSCLDDIGVSSQLVEGMMADILDSFDDPDCSEKRAGDSENEPVYRSDGTPEERRVLPGDDRNIGAHPSDADVDGTQPEPNAKSSCTEVDETTDGVAECRHVMLQRSEVVPDDSPVTELIRTDDEHGTVVVHGESLDREEEGTGANSGHQDLSDDHDITDSQQWLYDNLHGHLTEQHDEATRLNSLRVGLPQPPPGTSSVPLNAASRAVHSFSTEVDLVKLDIELTTALAADAPNLSRCCELLDGYSPYELSPGVLVQYPLFAGTVDVCCRWDGDQADELHTAARRLRAFMMAMYARHSVHEGFLTALNRQV